MKTIFNFTSRVFSLLTFVSILAISNLHAQTTGSSLAFDGVNDYVDLGGDVNFGTVSNFSGDFTFEAWVYNDGSGTWARVFDFGDSTNDYIIFTVKSGDSGQCRFEYRTGGGTKFKIDGGVFPTGVWTHVACRLPASGEASILLDGVEVASATGWPGISNIVGTTKNYLGKSQFNDPYFKGKIKEVRVWKEYRSGALINEWMDCELSGTEANLIGYYKLNEGIVGANNNAHDFHVQNYGVLTLSDGVLKNFNLTGTSSNWVADSPSSFSEDPVEQNVVEFSNRNDAYLLNNESNFDFDSEYTVEYWLFPNFNWPVYQLPLIKAEGGVISFYSQHRDGNIYFGQIGTAGFQGVAEASGLEYNKWTHITLTAKEENGGITNKIYFNGSLKATRFHANIQIPQTDEKVKLGSIGWFKMANIRFWDRALDEAEIAPNISTVYPEGTPNLISQYVDYSSFSAGLVDNIGNNDGVRNATPIFSNDPCFVQYTQEPQDVQLPNFGTAINLSADLRYCNDANFSYQWQKDGVDIPGATGLTYTNNSPNSNDLGSYQLMVTACGQTFPTRKAIITVANQGKILHFDGEDDYVSFSDLTGNSGYTVEARVRFDEDPINQNIIVNTDANEGLISGQMVVNSEGYLQHNMWLPNTNQMRSSTHPTKIRANKWYNVELHYNGVYVWIEIDDVVSPQTPTSGNTTTLPTWYLGKSFGEFGSFNGELDEVRIWTINASTIVNDVTVGASSNLKHYFQFNEGIAESDNNMPILVNTIADPYTAAVATLHNFDLTGSQSNWLGCDRYDLDVSITMPTDKQVTVGNQLTLEATVNGADGTETFQWYKDGQAIDGATSATYQKNTTLEDDGSYQVEVGRFNSCNTFSEIVEVFIKGTGEVLHFDGVNDHISIPSGNFYTSSYTVECWVKFDDEVSNQSIIVATGDNGPFVENTNQLFTDTEGYFVHSTFIPSSGTTSNVKALAPAIPNTWYHVAIRANNGGNGMQLLINGVVQGSMPTNTNLWAGVKEWLIGSSARVLDAANTTLKDNFHGEMDELRIWSSYRTNSLIQQNKDKELDDVNTATGLDYYYKFNQGFANGNNSGRIQSDRIPNYEILNTQVPYAGNAKYVNFDFEGEESNFLDCSPITKPELNYSLSQSSGLGLSIGQSLEFDLEIETGDTSLLSFQWIFDDQVIEGANEPLYTIESMTEDDFGTYKVAIEDMCSPVFYDTITVPYVPTTNTCYTNYSNPTNYPDSTRYIFCNGAEGESYLCNPELLAGFKTDYGYCDTETLYEGEEIVFEISLTEPQVLDLTLQNIQADVDMWVFGDDCDLDNCLASSLELGLQDEFIRVALPAGDFYVLIDEKEYIEFTAGNDSLVLDIQMYDTKCSFAQPIACGDEVSGMTTNGSNFIDNYDEFTGYTDTEQVYELIVTDPITINATLSGLSSDLDLFLLDSTCIENNLLISSRQVDSSDDMISYGVQPGTYYIIVDGKDGASGSFDLSVTCANYFDASVDETDAYIDLNWSIDKKTCVPQDTGIIVRLITTPNTILFEEEYTTAALTPDVITGTFRDLVGDDHSRMYVLRVYNRLSNETLCNEVKTGKTLPFQQPEILSVSQAEAADSIQLVFRNHSQLSEEFRIYRDGIQIGSLSEGYTEDSLIVAYVDRHNMDNDSTSLQDVSTYDYCIETRNVTLSTTYPQVCGQGTTFDVNFAATDGGTGDIVSLTWVDISAFADALIIKRNGIQIQMLSANETFYNDMAPIYGVVSEYSLTYLRDGTEKLTVTDNGYTEPNGMISGRLVTNEGNYPVQMATLTLTKDTVIQGEVTTLEIATTQSDFEGTFTFPDIIYGLSATFNVTASKSGSEFTPETESFELNSAFPQKTDLLFVDNQDIIVNPAEILDTLKADERILQNFVVLDWEYTYDMSETTHFSLKRNGELIFEGNDSAGKIDSFVDLTGVPGFTYVYSLEAFTYDNDDINTQMKTASAEYPQISPITNFEVTFDSQTQNSTGELVDPKVILNWANTPYLSENFDGFRIFRNNILIGEVGSNDNRDFEFITPPEEEGTYAIRAFRKINGATYEAASSFTLTFTALPLWKPGVVDDPFAFPPTSDRAIVIDLDIFNTFAEFYEAAVFTGVNVSRKAQGASDEEYLEIGDLTKQFIVNNADAQTTVQIWDALGIPNENYTYKVSTYLDLDGTRYTRDTIFDRICPEIVAPTNLQKNEEVGKVELTWTDNSITQGNLSQLYFNYSGYELSRRDITNGGTSELIATIPGSIEKYDDFLSNPVFNLFLDDYVSTDYEYTLKAYFDIDTSRYYSQSLSINAKPLDGATNEPLPTEFVASKDIPSHIKLCWEWNAAKQSEFIIYRDTVAIDTLPPTARAYYDYEAPSDPTVLYKITSLFNGNQSEYVLAEGRLTSNMRIQGRISNFTSGVGLEGVNVLYRNQGDFSLGLPQGLYEGSTLTDATGNYYFDDIPHTPGLTYQIKIFSNNADFAASEFAYNSFGGSFIPITSETDYQVDYFEYSEVDEDQEIVTPIAGINAISHPDSMFVEVSWSPEHGYYDGFQVFRENQLIQELKKGEGFTYKDRAGFAGINYVYSVRAYKSEAEGRVFSEKLGAAAVFPAIQPVENLTVTAYADMNLMLVQWSHPFDNHEVYRIRRNNQFVASIPAGSPMMWYDSTGIPGIEYQYEVTAIQNPNISVPVTVTKNYKGVGEAKNLSVEVNEFVPACIGTLTNDNHVSIRWEYAPMAAQGFEIYRDGQLIAEIDDQTLAFGDLPMVAGDTLMIGNVATYDDYDGSPGVNHTYHVLPYVEREGDRYTSGIEELYLQESIMYPQISEVSGLDVAQNNVLGSAEINFSFDQYVVSGFQILRDGMVIDTVLSSIDQNGVTNYTVQDFTGLPGQSYTYAVRAFDRRVGIAYFGSVNCDETIEYPIVPTPQDFTASQGTFENHIEIDWAFSTEAFVDSFYLENMTLGTEVTFVSGKRRFLEVVNDFTEDKYQYRMRASRINQGQTIYSEWTDVTDGWCTRQINGGEDENIENSILTSLNGYSTDIDGEWAVSGAPGGVESIFIYRRINGGWSLYQQIKSPNVNVDIDFGLAVAISGNTIIAGAPKSGNGQAYIYQLSGELWSEIPQVLTSPGPGNFGWSVDIDGDELVVGNPLWTGPCGATEVGAIYIYERSQSGLWTDSAIFAGQTQTGCSIQRFGYGTAIEDGFVAVSCQRNPGSQYSEVMGYVKDANGNWGFNGFFSQNAYSWLPYLVNDNLDLNDNVLVIGDEIYNSYRGRVRVVELENNIASNFTVIDGTEINSNFGRSVAVQRIASPIEDAIYVAVGVPYSNIPLTDQGNAKLYSNVSGTFQLLSEISDDDVVDAELTGWSVALSDESWGAGLVRDNDLDNGSFEISNLLSAPKTMNATDGISTDFDPTKTTISWEFDGNYDLLAGFNIYRDEEFLTYRDKATMTVVGPGIYTDGWDDNSGNAGQPYVYAVKSVNNLVPFESYGTSEEGYNRANGVLQGAVTTQLGQVPIPGVTITATGIVDGEVFTYKTETLSNGSYIFNDVYYSSEEGSVTEYTVEGSFLDHVIIPQTSDIALFNPLNDPTQDVVNFFDVTAYVIKGNVAQPDVNCPLEGIKMTLIQDGLPLIGQEAYTDAGGNYSLVIDPFVENLQELRIRIDQQLDVEQVVTSYNFQPDADTIITDFTALPIITEINFNDELTYDVELRVKSTCNDPISTGKWDVRIRTLDGCFDQTYQTSTTGDLTVPLIPQNYTMKVVGVDVPTAINQQALDYFANFPITLNLLDTHIDSIETLTKAEIEEMSERQFTFHKAANIEVGGLDELICNTQTAVLSQQETYTLDFNVFEIFDGSQCYVEEGLIEITNPASTDDGPVIVYYDKASESFPSYTFTAGNPNPVFPHAYAITFDYKSDDGVFLGRKIRAAFVEGSIAIPGTDIIVDPASGNDAVPYPLMVLRDPPGDQSSSYIAAGQTISFDTEITVENSFDGSIYSELETEVFSIGVDLNTSINGGYTKEKSIVLSNEITTSTTISTSDDEDNIGRGADVIVGTGLVTQFGTIREFRVGECDEIIVEKKIGISPNSATTTWSYQISQVEEIIQGFVNDSLRLEANGLTITRNGEELSREDARVFLHSNIDNWKEVIEYHDVKTVPYYVLCTMKPSDLISSDHATQLGYWQAQIKPLFGEDVNGEFVLKDEIIWDQQLINIYNAASAAIRNIQQGGDLNIWSFPYTGDQSSVDLSIPGVGFDLVDLGSILSNPGLIDYTAQFGDQVKNITTGGNITIEESIENVSASETTMNQSIYLGTELDIAGSVGGDVTLETGGFAGLGAGVIFGTVTEVTSTEFTVGVAIETQATRSNNYTSSIEEAVEVGYTIFDDDNIDAFSFAVIQGVAPNMTPYFDYFGGHSSCPPEDGSVFVDDPTMGIIVTDPDGNEGSAPSHSLFNVPAEDAATFVIRAENQSPIASAPDRELKLFLESSSNPNGAIVKLNGVSLNNAEYVDSFSVGDPQDLILTIERGPTEYDYPDIQIGFEPTCGEGPREYVYASAYFVNPCSPVTLVSPIENWVINDDTTKLVITMQDYDPTNPFLVDATVQYRRIGTGDDWTDIPALELEQGNSIIADSLAANDAEYAEGQIEKYFFIWTIPTTEGAYPDGDYEVRTKMTCDNFSSTLSNVISGKIARDGLNLFGNPQPADQIWTAGDEISFTFNNDLDCALLTESFIDGNVSVYNETTGVEEAFTLSCYANKVIFVMDNPMSDYDGQFLTINVDNIPSIEGNISLPHSWTFRVITQKVYWADADTVKLRMYQDDVQSVILNLENSTLNETISGLTFVAADGGFGDWLTITDPMTQPFSVNPSGRPITFEVDASEPVGIYNETINVAGVEAFGNTPQLHIQLEVLVKPPNWEVDPGDYSTSMNMISNWKYSTEDPGTISTDVADLISVWVGNEIRGVAPITESGEFFASYLTIYGSLEDGNDAQLEFRVWDADLGIEYDGHPADSIFYAANTSRGTTVNPEMLDVDAEYDKARYLHLRQGWTGFSLPDSTSNMDVAHKLRSLATVSDGDLIVTGDKFSQYTDSLGWFNFGASNLATISNNEGYMIYLEDGPDTLRVTGTAPSTNDIELKSGWNWLGFPFANDEEINDVLNLNTANSTGEDKIKLDFPLDGEIAEFANYNLSGDNWNNGNMDFMKPNNLYKLYSGHPNGAILSWTPQNNVKGVEEEETSARMSAVVDPDDPTTWVMPDLASDEVMPVIAEVLIGGVAANDPADMVAFFENDTIRALGYIEYIEELMVWEVSMLAESSGSAYDIRYFDASEGTVSQATNTLNFDMSGVGDVFDPYEIVFEVSPCPGTLILGPTGDPFAVDRTFEASQEIKVRGSLNIPAGVNIILSAPKVTIEQQLNTNVGSQVIVRPDGCNE